MQEAQPAVLSGAPQGRGSAWVRGARGRGERAAGLGARGERALAGAAQQGGAQAKGVDTVQWQEG